MNSIPQCNDINGILPNTTLNVLSFIYGMYHVRLNDSQCIYISHCYIGSTTVNVYISCCYIGSMTVNVYISHCYIGSTTVNVICRGSVKAITATGRCSETGQ